MELSPRISHLQTPESQPEYAGTLEYLPVFMEVKGRRCLVTGGGDAAARKTGVLLKAGARVTVAASEVMETLSAWARDGRIEWRQRLASPSDIKDSVLVFAASESPQENQDVAEQARELGIPVNVADHPEASTFIMPAIIERSPVLVAVASGGASPVLSRLLRSRLERALPRGLGRLAHLAGRFREQVKMAIATIPARTAFWESMLEGPAGDLALAGQMEAAEAVLERALSGGAPRVQGCVYLVGAGPGDPDLLTLRAVRLLERADAIVYDRLAAPEILEFARRDAECIYVGKAADRHTLPQEEINALLVRLGQEGKQVVRLKGG
ncbi:MAG: SAM-dependent methyltransferase, partial [Deltaproteobacteria bacterium]|nr:SAM-dependent methyltransferase [Deltaproteobacteria bacterium]